MEGEIGQDKMTVTETEEIRGRKEREKVGYIWGKVRAQGPCPGDRRLRVVSALEFVCGLRLYVLL